MELTPQLLTDEIDFRIAYRGYDRNEVDDFLERVAVAVGQLQTQLGKAINRAKTAEARLSDLEADPTSVSRSPVPAVATEPEPAPIEEPVQEVEAKVAPVTAEAPISDDDALNDELRRTLVLAQRTADAAIREAHEQAKAIVDEANTRASSETQAARDDAARLRDEARGKLLHEVRELEALREQMRNDTVVLERYLGNERARVRETIQVLRRLVDDPKSFSPQAVPELSEVAIDDDQVLPQRNAELEKDPAEAKPVEIATESNRSDDPSPLPEEETLVESDVEPEGIENGAIEPQTAPVVHDDVEADVAVDTPVEVEVEEFSETQTNELPKRSNTATESLGQLFDSAGTRDWRSASPERGDQGPHTQPVAAARFEEESDEAFLAELRRAMDEDEPLGPERDR